uniref:Programmed cell death protein 7 n=1 Tax=Lygus hesperus TaxID=30085 RepID=A0A0A9VWK8_LYGHE
MTFNPYFGDPSMQFTASPFPGPLAMPFGLVAPPPNCFPDVPGGPLQLLPDVGGNICTPNYLPAPQQEGFTEEELRALVSKYKLLQRPSSPKLNVSTISVLLSGYKRLINSVERIWKYLEVTKKTLSEEDWTAKCKELDRKKELMEEIEKQLNDPYFKALVEKTVKRAKARRERIKRRNIEWKAKKKQLKVNREEKHKKIDLWLEKMKDEVERAQRAEMVKNEADAVLSGVTQKKSEAKRMLGLLNSLTKLRNAKLAQLASFNNHVSEEETKTFNLVIDKLKNKWVKQLKEYNIEEQGLKVMLSYAEAERVNTEERTWRRTLNTWTETLFGEKKMFDPLQAQPSDFDHFVAVRSDWDQYINAEDAVLTSCIPSGWVVPVMPSNSDWAQHCTSKQYI